MLGFLYSMQSCHFFAGKSGNLDKSGNRKTSRAENSGRKRKVGEESGRSLGICVVGEKCALFQQLLTR